MDKKYPHIALDRLHDKEYLSALDASFMHELNTTAPELAEALQDMRSFADTAITNSMYSELLIEIAPFFEAFIARLFAIEAEIKEAIIDAVSYHELYNFKRNFIQRVVAHKYSKEDVAMLRKEKILAELTAIMGGIYSEELFVERVHFWLQDKILYVKEIELSEKWAALQLYESCPSVLFTMPKKINYASPSQTLKASHNPNFSFSYMPPADSKNFAALESHYCLACHKQNKDSCRKGLITAGGEYTQNTLGNHLAGCPLDQRISEMILAKANGYNLAALAIAMIDNPLIALTGHRICNDCAKSCIYQKQSHVDVPIIESELFRKTLHLPWGAEIYNLLLLWNPLSITDPLPRDASARNILVVGSGPAGLSMAYYLLRSGHNVTIIDGLKIEPLPNIAPIKSWQEFAENNTLPADGFGGVASYGITSRWNKEHLQLLKIIFTRWPRLHVEGGTMLGANLAITQAFNQFKFDHLCLALGAGAPKWPQIPGIMSRGVMAAADFLMNLNLYKPYLASSTSALQIRLPLVVIGGGLTAIDAAVEAIKYYIELVRKFAILYTPKIAAKLSQEEQAIAQEYLLHSELLKDNPDIKNAIAQIGGVTILYRNALGHSPAYRLNHDEMKDALAYGIKILEDITVTEIIQDDYGAASEIAFIQNEEQQKIVAKTILVATGTKHGEYYLTPEEIQYQSKISILGDMDPKFHGSVVKALASSKAKYREINQQLGEPLKTQHGEADLKIEAIIVSAEYRDNEITKLVIQAPLAAESAQAGQFFKLELYSNTTGGVLTEPIAVSAAHIDYAAGHITFNIYNVGGSTSLCRHLKQGQIVSLMGPLGRSLGTISGDILLIGENYGNAILNHIASYFKAEAISLTHIACYDKIEEQELTNTHVSDQLITGRSQNIREVLEQLPSKNSINHIIIVASLNLITKLQEIWPAIAHFFASDVVVEALLTPAMQCMMQGQCGKCTLPYLNRDGGLELFFACKNQYLSLAKVDTNTISARAKQNSLLEKIIKYT